MKTFQLVASRLIPLTAFAGLPFTAAAQQTETTVVSTATTAITPLKDSASLHRAGYFAIGFGGGLTVESARCPSATSSARKSANDQRPG